MNHGVEYRRKTQRLIRVALINHLSWRRSRLLMGPVVKKNLFCEYLCHQSSEWTQIFAQGP